MPGVEESVNGLTLATQPFSTASGYLRRRRRALSWAMASARWAVKARVVVVTLAGHQIESAELYEVNGKLTGTTYTIMRGDQTAANQTALQYCDGWTENRIGFGRAYAVVTAIDPEELRQAFRTSRLKLKGKCYDPRKDTTVGGDGIYTG